MGSGKSEIAVIDFCQYVRIPNFIGIITRRTTPLLKGAGGILTKCKRTFAKEFKDDPDYTYNWKEKDNKFVFYKKEKNKDGKDILIPISEVYLKHSEYENDIEALWQGIESSLTVIDESTQYTWPMVNYIMSRMRNPSCPEVRPRLKMTCNPLKTHFLRKWVDPYLKEDGTPDRSKDGLIRYFQMVDGEIYFADTKEEVMEYAQCTRDEVLSFTFISATVADNKILQEIDPRYVSWLKGLKGVERERLLMGSWNAIESTSNFFQRTWVHELDQPPPASEFTKIVRAYDFAGTLPSDASPKTDYFASVKMGKLKNGEYVILDVTRTKIRYGDWPAHIIENSRRDGTRVDIVFPVDPNAASQGATKDLIKLCAVDCGRIHTTRALSNKLDRFRPFSSMSQNGLVSVVKGCANDLWNKIYNDNEFFYAELEGFDGGRKGHDDMADCCSDAFMYLASKINLGNSFLHGIKNTNLSTNSGLLAVGRHK